MRFCFYFAFSPMRRLCFIFFLTLFSIATYAQAHYFLLPLRLCAIAPKRKPTTGNTAASGATDLKGKKTAATATSAATADLKKGEGDWVKSILKEATLMKLH